ncbi:MAG: hydroxyacid dehydrogenase [Firmicutes bacterium]|nr:hydroxyacid dehydrogenase [Bacillota bacterium]
MKIVLMEPLGISPEKLEEVSSFLTAAGHSFTAYNDRAATADELAERIGDAEILILANQPLREDVLSRCPNLKMISIGFTGVDHVDVDYCKSRGILLSNASGYSTNAVAELAIGLMVAVSRNVIACDAACRAGKDKSGLIGFELAGKTLGIVGTGAIGLKTAEIAKAIGCRLVAYSRSQRPEALAMGIEYMPLEQLMQESDIVSLHVPVTPATKGLIDEKMLSLMKPNAILINTARGPVVDSAALAAALQEGRIAGAGLDVFDTEPPLPEDQPLRDCPRTVVTPHVAFATRESMVKRAIIVFENIRQWLAGTPINQI